MNDKFRIDERGQASLWLVAVVLIGATAAMLAVAVGNRSLNIERSQDIADMVVLSAVSHGTQAAVDLAARSHAEVVALRCSELGCTGRVRFHGIESTANASQRAR